MPIKVLMPALSPTMTEGNLAKWLKKEGDTIESGDVIAEIETDKATMEVEAVDEGVLGKILVSEGTQNVAVNELIAVLLEEGENDNDIEDFINDKSAQNAAPKTSVTPSVENKAPAVSKAAPKQPSTPVQQGGVRVFASPLAKRIAADKGIDLSQVQGSGPKGRIVKADVEGFTGGASAPQMTSSTSPVQPTGDQKVNEFGMVYTEIPNNNVKKITATRLQESKQSVPHFYLTIECQIDELLRTRKMINEAANGEYKLSVNDFIVKACANALKAYPAANVSWSEEAVRQYVHSDISVAVSTPNGLITPIVKQAENKGLRAISDEIKDLAGRAREGKLKPEEFQGGAFSVSNLGMYGIAEFGAIINPPQACILAVGAGEQKPYVHNGEVKIGTFMKATLSVDHRAVDGAVGAEYLKVLKNYIENPAAMLL
ncbi:MAG: pyruvate dehydrogenase complex dihydrolipoamide acetyltransferase [Alphaproteobacteria bacterium]|nr:pyruvate dehydrogenase complex dihydrolipoamide acetyltransferase [Alphaproteobacteria bacterium]